MKKFILITLGFLYLQNVSLAQEAQLGCNDLCENKPTKIEKAVEVAKLAATYSAFAAAGIGVGMAQEYIVDQFFPDFQHPFKRLLTQGGVELLTSLPIAMLLINEKIRTYILAHPQYFKTFVAGRNSCIAFGAGFKVQRYLEGKILASDSLMSRLKKGFSFAKDLWAEELWMVLHLQFLQKQFEEYLASKN